MDTSCTFSAPRIYRIIQHPKNNPSPLYLDFFDRGMATNHHFTKSSDPDIKLAAYVYKGGGPVPGNQVCNILLVSELDYQMATHSLCGENGTAPGSHGGASL